jgi:anti-sigma regulatory factor (Ser/Thr protein kinase)
MAEGLDVSLPGGFRAAAEARLHLEDLSSELPPEVLEDLRLLVNELVTNSVRHARVSRQDQIRLIVELDSKCVRVEVVDQGPGFEVISPTPSISQASGWGLYLVEQLADRWGVETRDGTVVWFEIDR